MFTLQRNHCSNPGGELISYCNTLINNKKEPSFLYVPLMKDIHKAVESNPSKYNLY
jgi:hypothetical protein